MTKCAIVLGIASGVALFAGVSWMCVDLALGQMDWHTETPHSFNVFMFSAAGALYLALLMFAVDNWEKFK